MSLGTFSALQHPRQLGHDRCSDFGSTVSSPRGTKQFVNPPLGCLQQQSHNQSAPTTLPNLHSSTPVVGFTTLQ